MDNKPHLIMIIEDEVMLLEAIQKKLQNIGFETVTFTKATDALRYFTDGGTKPAAIWLDYYLEDDIDGIAFMQKLNEHADLSSIPVVVVSNSASPDKVNAMVALGVKKYLLKAENRLEDVANTLHDVLNPPNGQQ
jgi:CheY-like chemotaxis protein